MGSIPVRIFPATSKLMREEYQLSPHDSVNSPIAADGRWEQLTEQYKGKIDATRVRLSKGIAYSDLTKAREQAAVSSQAVSI